MKLGAKKKQNMLIGLVGKKGSGKDTVADFLIDRFNFMKIAFADPLKKVLQVLFLLEDRQLHDPKYKEMVDDRWGMSPRQMMQMMGTDIVRAKFGEDFWLKHMDYTLKQHETKFIVISDVRFKNEAEWVRNNGGILIRLRTETDNLTLDTHQSECELDEISTDYEILNDKSLGLVIFHQCLVKWFERIFQKN